MRLKLLREIERSKIDGNHQNEIGRYEESGEEC